MSLCVIRQGFAHKEAWKKVTPSIQWNETRIVMLNISFKHIRHQHQNGGRKIKECALKDE
jgi:hypothetical protein